MASLPHSSGCRIRVNDAGRAGEWRVILLWTALFFLFASLASWLLLFPSARERAGAWLVRRWRLFAGRAAQAGRGVAVRVEDSGRAARATGARAFDGLLHHRVVLVAALALLLLPPILILGLRRHVVLEGFGSEDLSESSSMIAQLLRGERLVPPSPPPPEVFTNAEVRRIKPEIVSADRRWERVDPELQQRVLAIFEVMRRQYGYRMVLVEGYRSPGRQAELMRGGRATRAGAWQSCHQYGLAVDIAPLRDGRLQWDMGDAWTRRAYHLYGELAQQAGLEWGGNWRGLKDYVHVEMAAECRRARQARRERQVRDG